MIIDPHGPTPVHNPGYATATVWQWISCCSQHTTLNSHFEPWNGFMFSLAYMKNLPSFRENLSITIQRMSALTPRFFFRASANKLSCMNSHTQIVIQDSGVFMWQLCIYVVSQIATQQKKCEL